MKALYGHTSPETAYLVEDYPYGFRLRTQIRYWIEKKEGFGQRMVSQTLNPKNGKWNKPKAGTYSDVYAIYLDDVNHVQSFGLTGYSDEETIARFEAYFPELVETDYFTSEAIRFLRAKRRAEKHITWTVKSHECSLRPDCAGCAEAGPRQTLDEQAEIFGKAIRHELWQDSLEAIRRG